MNLRISIFLGSFVEALSPMGINGCEGYAWLQQVTLPQWDTGNLSLWGGESDWTQVCREIKSENSALHSTSERQELGDLGPSSFLHSFIPVTGYFRRTLCMFTALQSLSRWRNADEASCCVWQWCWVFPVHSASVCIEDFVFFPRRLPAACSILKKNYRSKGLPSG